MLSDLLYADHFALMSEIMEGLGNNVIKLKEAIEQAFKVNLRKATFVVAVVSSPHQSPRCGV